MLLFYYNVVVKVVMGIKFYVFVFMNCVVFYIFRNLFCIYYLIIEQYGIGLGVIVFVIGVKVVDGIVYLIGDLSYELFLYEVFLQFGNFVGCLFVGIIGLLG